MAGEVFYLIGLLFAEGLRFHRRVDRVRAAPDWQRATGRSRIPEAIVLAAVILGIWVFPLVFIFSSWLAALDYSLPFGSRCLGAGVFAMSLVVRWQAQRALGRQWSFTLETSRDHALVTQGIYARVRHPIYASLILWALGQPFLLQNAVAGFGGAVAVALIWCVRVPREERMMRERFGESYQRYENSTGRLIPKF